MIREAGALSKVELTRSSGLSKQTLTVLVGRLEETGLLIRKEPERGRVGQPLARVIHRNSVRPSV